MRWTKEVAVTAHEQIGPGTRLVLIGQEIRSACLAFNHDGLVGLPANSIRNLVARCEGPQFRQDHAAMLRIGEPLHGPLA
ncbi:unnamed protein product [Sphagnum balticum]